MKIEIKHRFTGAVLFTAEVADDDAYPIRTALKQAIAADANLADAYLARANLAGAYLARANLAGANLAGAYLADANLADANLAGANLAGAYLADANLADAYLARANLAGAYLARANLADADLADAYLADANLADANLADAYLVRANLADAYLVRANLADADLADAYLADANNLDPTTLRTDPPEPYKRAVTDEEIEASRIVHLTRYRERHPEVPVVDNLDAKILAAIGDGGKLEMSTWHTCNTTHCRGGWAVTLAGEVGRALERKYDTQRAASMIYRASTGRVPWFFDSNEGALADIKQCAERSAQ